MLTFKVTKINMELVKEGLISLAFSNEAVESNIEFISQPQILDAVRPYLKDPIGTQVVYSSANITGTPISKIEIINHMGELLIRLERSCNTND